MKPKAVQDKRAKVPVRVMNQACAEKVVRAAQKKARELGITMSVAVVDESGNLVHFVRGDTSSFITFETARGKAVAAAGFRRPTQDYEPHFKEHPAFWSSISENLKLVPGPGGYPLTRKGVMIGGVGCGGGLGEDALMHQSDYPHGEAMFPDTAQFVMDWPFWKELGPRALAKHMSGNAAKFLRLST